MQPFKQGALDALCGVYSIINSAKIINGLNHEDSQGLFEDIICYLDQSRDLSKIIVEGLNINVIDEIMNNIESLNLNRKILFRGRTDIGLNEFWSSMQEFLEVSNRTVLISLSGVHNHWSVVKEISDKRITFYDSDGIKQINRIHCTTKASTSNRKHQILVNHSYFLS